MSSFPEFNEHGDLPVGIYNATLQEVIEHFGKHNFQRRLIANRLLRIYNLAKSTGYLARFVVYGSFITSKPKPNDVDIFLLMDESFVSVKVFGDARVIFDHIKVHEEEGASVFWSKRGEILGSEESLIEDWQLKRDKTRRGIVEVINYD